MSLKGAEPSPYAMASAMVDASCALAREMPMASAVQEQYAWGVASSSRALTEAHQAKITV